MTMITTVQGDTFDTVALRAYGNERRMDVLIPANPEHNTTVVFSADIVLRVPELPEDVQNHSDNLPPWRLP